MGSLGPYGLTLGLLLLMPAAHHLATASLLAYSAGAQPCDLMMSKSSIVEAFKLKRQSPYFFPGSFSEQFLLTVFGRTLCFDSLVYLFIFFRWPEEELDCLKRRQFFTFGFVFLLFGFISLNAK